MNKIKQIGNKIKDGLGYVNNTYLILCSRNTQAPKYSEEDGPGDQPLFDQKDKDLVRRKIQFEDDMQVKLKLGEGNVENNQVTVFQSDSSSNNSSNRTKFMGLAKPKGLKQGPRSFQKFNNCSASLDNASELAVKDLSLTEDTNDSMKLKRLFKSRAKKLVERAESFACKSIDTFVEEYSSTNKEEKKEPMEVNKLNEYDLLELIGAKPLSPQEHYNKSCKICTSAEAEREEEDKENKKEETNEEEFMKSREEPSQLCGTKRSHSHYNKEEFERSLSHFTCTICMDYMVGAKMLQCGHCFCDQWISFWFLREKGCPICRDKIRDEKNVDCSIVDFTIENILTRAYQKDSSIRSELKNWQTRRDKYQDWKESHNLKAVKIGDRIDVRDTEYIWWTGAVEKILKSKYNWADLLYIHYDGWNRCYDEYIPADSDRVAPLNIYTSRSDIPKYTRHDGVEDRVYGNVVEGGEQQNDQDENTEANNDNDNQQENSANQRNQEENNVSHSHEEDNNDEEGETPPVRNLRIE